jgi:hypothetical protein
LCVATTSFLVATRNENFGKGLGADLGKCRNLRLCSACRLRLDEPLQLGELCPANLRNKQCKVGSFWC